MACAFCDTPFPASRIKGTGGRWKKYCSASCGLQGYAFNGHGREIGEIVRLLYPFMHTQELADFIGVSATRLINWAHVHGVCKDRQWLAEQGRGTHWPEDPALRELYRLHLLLKRTTTIKTKELNRERG